jgi:endo-1,4-beta-xylanase
MSFNRRETIGLLGGAGLASLSGCANTAQIPTVSQATGLNDLARTKGLRFGTAIGSDALQDPAYLDVIKRECGILVAENEHKIYVTQGEKGPMDYSRGDAIVDFAEENDMAMRGHVLLWNRDDFLPAWMPDYDFGPDPRQGMKDYLTDYIRDLATHYKGRISSWDVVNETISPETGLMRDTVFTRNYGPDVVDFAFREARKHLPDTQLVYNDYMIWEPGNEKHISGVLKLLEHFRKNDVPIDAFGVQSHLGTGDGSVYPSGVYPDPQRKEFRQFIDEIVAMDYDLILSEFDVNDTRLPADVATRDRLVADYGGAFLDMMLDYSEVKDVLAWGLSDKYSWLQEWWPREDGVEKRSTLFDKNMEPKPLYYAVEKSFKTAKPR